MRFRLADNFHVQNGGDAWAHRMAQAPALRHAKFWA